MTEQLFKNFDDSVIRAEFKHFSPLSKMNFNVPNKKTTFLIEYNENFASKNFEFYISGEYKKATNSDYTANSTVKLIDNFIPHLFSFVEVKKHNKIIDEVDYPGITSTMKHYVTYTKDHNSAAEAAGSLSNYSGGGKFYTLGKLADFGLGFFEDLNIPIFKGGFEINFTRNTDNDALYRWKSDSTQTIPDEGKIIITNFYIRVPIIEYEDNAKIQLLKSLGDSNAYDFEYKTWQCVQHKNVSGKTLNFDITNVYRNFNSPVFAMITFQTDKSNNQLANPSEFDHKFVRNIYVEVNGKRYPEELTDLDFENDDYLIAFNMFRDYRRVFKRDDYNLLTPREFKAHKSIFVIDLSKQPDSISNSKSNIVLHVDFSKNVDSSTGTSEGTVCYVNIVSYKRLRYDMFRNLLNDI